MAELLTPFQDFDIQKRKYFSRFSQARTSAFRPHYNHGETLGKRPEVWRNVSEHCLVAGAFADVLAEELGLPEDQKDTLVRAAIVHDWYKKHESAAQRAAASAGTLTVQTLDEVKARDVKALQEMGVSQEIIDLAGANVPENTQGPQELARKIMWFIDAMLSNTVPVPIEERFLDLERGWDGTKEDPARAQRNIAFSNLYTERFDGKSLYEVQRELGRIIGAEFAEIIGYQGKADQLPYYFAEKLAMKILAQDSVSELR